MLALLSPRTWLIGAAAALLISAGGWLYWKGGKNAAAEVHGHYAEVLGKISKLAAESADAAVKSQNAWNAAVAQIDATRSQEKADALANNEKLRGDIASGARRLRIAASCPARGDDMPAATSAASVDAATTVELAPATGQAVLDIRAGIIADQAALSALQDYVKRVCPAAP